MDLYILRHAEAAERGEQGITRDADRPLTKNGEKKLRKTVERFHGMEISFDVILSSPFRRAKETAEIVGEVLECRSIIKLTSHLVVGSKPVEIVKEINENYSDKESILLVGHEPFLGNLVSMLISGSYDASIKLKKGGFCKLSVDGLRFGKCATLDLLMGPSQFSA